MPEGTLPIVSHEEGIEEELWMLKLYGFALFPESFTGVVFDKFSFIHKHLLLLQMVLGII